MHTPHEGSYLAAILDASDAAIIGKNLGGMITSWNRAAERLFGYTAEEALGQSISLISPPDRPREEDLVLSRLRSGAGLEHYETVRRRKDGQLIDIVVTVSPIKDRDGSVIGAVTIARAIAGHQQRLVRELEEVGRLKDEFLATLSHELRTPLNAVMGYARMLSAGGLGDSGREHAIELINRNARILARLISDMLDISTIVTGKMQLTMRPCDVVAIVQSAIEVVRPDVHAKRITLTQAVEDAPLVVLGDPDRLRQVFWNLLTNAVTFTDEGGRIEVGLTRTASRIRVTIADTGIGIDPEFLPHLFERFRQAHGTPQRPFGGLGLGLALVRHLLQLHGGRVAATSRGPGQGSTFQVTLPQLDEST